MAYEVGCVGWEARQSTYPSEAEESTPSGGEGGDDGGDAWAAYGVSTEGAWGRVPPLLYAVDAFLFFDCLTDFTRPFYNHARGVVVVRRRYTAQRYAGLVPRPGPFWLDLLALLPLELAMPVTAHDRAALREGFDPWSQPYASREEGLFG